MTLSGSACVNVIPINWANGSGRALMFSSRFMDFPLTMAGSSRADHLLGSGNSVGRDVRGSPAHAPRAVSYKAKPSAGVHSRPRVCARFQPGPRAFDQSAAVTFTSYQNLYFIPARKIWSFRLTFRFVAARAGQPGPTLGQPVIVLKSPKST